MTSDFFPRYGRVAIVDDKYEDVKKIQSLLASEGIPYIFYDYKEMQELEKIEQVDGIRLLFLDIRLEDGTSGEKNLYSILASTIERIIPPQNGPYAIILWTNEFEKEDAVKEYLNNNLRDDETTKPSFISAVDKKDIITKPFNESIELLATALNSHYADHKMVAFLNEIENRLMSVPSSTLKMITHSFIKDASNDELEKLFMRLAWTESGNCNSTENATKTVLRLVADLIRDRYMEIVASGDTVATLSSLWKVDESIIKEKMSGDQAEQIALINASLNVNAYSPSTDNVPGKVYKHSDETIPIEADYLLHSTISNNESKIVINSGGTEIETILEPIEIDITPSCDYAQGNNRMLRTLLGYIVYIDNFPKSLKAKKLKEKIEGKVNGFVYVTPLFKINDKFCVLVLNTKLLNLEKQDYCEHLEYLFRLNDEITNEIRQDTGSGLSRLGINSVNE